MIDDRKQVKASLYWDYYQENQTSIKLLARSHLVLNALRLLDGAQLTTCLCDTRDLHKQLFYDLTPHGYDCFAGNYRGTTGTPIENYWVSVKFLSDPPNKVWSPGRVLPPQDVAQHLADLNLFIEETMSVHSGKEDYYVRAVRIFHDFLFIHPYVNGNGHIARLILAALMFQGGIKVSIRWTVHPRPYSSAMHYCLVSYSTFQDLLESYLRNWFFVD